LGSGSRRRGREAALQILFQIDASGVAPSRARQLYWSELAAGRPGDPAARQFADHLVDVVQRRQEEIDAAIRAVSEHWRLERMGQVDRNVIRLALAELLEDTTTPAAVILDEAIEIAKRYGGEESGQFVNGVLDALKRRLEEGRQPAPDED
jgi:N utilization substance protein B